MRPNDLDVDVQRLLVRERSREPLSDSKRDQLTRRLQIAAARDAHSPSRAVWLTTNLRMRLTMAFSLLLLVAGGAAAFVATTTFRVHRPVIAPPRTMPESITVAPAPVPLPQNELLPSSALRAEIALIAGARRALAAGRVHDGAQMLASHAQRFPAGTLIEEREGLGIMVLWRQGQKSEARKAAQRFSQRYPQSPMNQPLRELIGDSGRNAPATP